MNENDRPRRASGGATERWWIAYANLVTLLLALFIVLYAMSKTDHAKFTAFSRSMRKGFANAPGTESGDGGPADAADSAPGDENADLAKSARPRETRAERWSRERRELKVSFEELAIPREGAERDEAGAGAQVEAHEQADGLLIRIVANGYFDPGAIDVKPDLLPLLDKIGRILSHSRRKVRIEAHADPREAAALAKTRAPGGFPSGWELSAARAGWVARHFAEAGMLEPERITIAGHGEFEPIGTEPEAGAEGFALARRRRLEIVVLEDQAKTQLSAEPKE